MILYHIVLPFSWINMFIFFFWWKYLFGHCGFHTCSFDVTKSPISERKGMIGRNCFYLYTKILSSYKVIVILWLIIIMLWGWWYICLKRLDCQIWTVICHAVIAIIGKLQPAIFWTYAHKSANTVLPFGFCFAWNIQWLSNIPFA